MDTHPFPNGSSGSDTLSSEAEDLLRRLRTGELVPPPTGSPPGDPEGQPSRRRSALREALSARLPGSMRGATLDPALRGALGLGLVALVAALAALGLAWRSAPSPVAAPAAPVVSPVAAPSVPVAPPSAVHAATAATAGPELVVDVAGRVRHPGVVSLPPGARVADAVEQAGGVLPGTDTSALSLARKLVDGEQVLVTGKPGTAPPADAASPPVAGSSGSTTVAAADPSAAPSTPLDLNSATVDQLDGLPGVGPVLAGRIVEYRTAHNGFTSVDQLREVKGLGGKTGEQLLSLVHVG